MKLNRTFFWSIIMVATLAACGGTQTTTHQTEDTTKTEAKEEPKIKVDDLASARAQIMGAVEVKNKAGLDSLLKTDLVKQHYEEFNRQWKKLEDSRLSKMRVWREKELAKINGESHTLFYPFSGPDFLNAYEFFPNCDNYLMFGLEPDGKLVDIQKMPANYLPDLRNALGEIFERNYFITSFMGRELWGKGVLPIVNIFMARTGNQVVKIERFYLDKSGKPQFFPLEQEDAYKDKLRGIMVEFLNEKKTKSQKIYYFGTNVQDNEMKNKMELVEFIKSFPDKIGFIKSASYILHNTDFAVIRNLLLDEASAILQDDTGIRYSVYKENAWDVKLYGKYARPIADFGAYTFQNDLNAAFKQDSTIKKLDFTYGYHWKTDNTSVMLCFRPANAPKQSEVKQEEKKEAKKEEKKNK
jgi:hypothetical protein